MGGELFRDFFRKIACEVFGHLWAGDPPKPALLEVNGEKHRLGGKWDVRIQCRRCGLRGLLLVNVPGGKS